MLLLLLLLLPRLPLCVFHCVPTDSLSSLSCGHLVAAASSRCQSMHGMQERSCCRLRIARATGWQRKAADLSNQRAGYDVRRCQCTAEPLHGQALCRTGGRDACAARDAMRGGIAGHGAALRAVLPEDDERLRRSVSCKLQPNTSYRVVIECRVILTNFVNKLTV